MIWGGRWKGGSALGTHVHPWLIHVNVRQNQYSIVKQKKRKKNELNAIENLSRQEVNSTLNLPALNKVFSSPALPLQFSKLLVLF